MDRVTDVPLLADVEASALADSLHDLDSPGGWTYAGSDNGGTLRVMETCEPSTGEWVGDGFRVSSDKYAVFARDTLHVGHSISPTLTFTATRDLRAKLLVRAALIQPKAILSTRLSVLLGDQLMCEIEYNYGRVATISGTLDLRKNDVLLVRFAKVEDILYQLSLYHAVLLDLGDGTGEAATLAAAAIEDPAWAELRSRLGAQGPANMDPSLLARIAYDPFGPLPDAVKAADWTPAERYTAGNFGAFREPNFFSPRRARPEAGK